MCYVLTLVITALFFRGSISILKSYCRGNSPHLQSSINKIASFLSDAIFRRRFEGVLAIIVTDRDGVPLVKGTRSASAARPQIF